MNEQTEYQHTTLKSPQGENPRCHGCLVNEEGVFILATGLAVLALFAFTALGIEVGRWYVVRAELSKSVDAAALVGAKNLSNPFLDSSPLLDTSGLMKAVGKANFSTGFFDSDGDPVFTPDTVSLGNGKVSMYAATNVFNRIGRMLDTVQHDTTTVGSLGVAQHRDAEIMMVLDESGSMGGQPIVDLKKAAKSFLDFFHLTQDNDKFGLITFASGVTVDFNLGNNFVDPMKLAIDEMSASGGTNTEDAIDRADVDDLINNEYGFTDQTGVAGDEKIQQFLIFFSDGNPTAFRGNFTRDGVDYDAVGYAASWNIKLMAHDQQFTFLNVKQFQTGDGLPTSSTVCQSGSPASGYLNTKWSVLEDLTYGVNGYSSFGNVYYSILLGTTDPTKCSINWNTMKSYVLTITKQMAIDHAQELKDKGIKIYTIGLGGVDTDFLGAIATGPAFEYYTADSTALTDLFQKIAKNIKLRLIQ